MGLAVTIAVLLSACIEQVVFWNKIIGNDCNWKVSK